MEKRKKICLEVQNERGESWVIPVDKDSFILGRESKCDLILSSGTISRNHAEIESSSQGYLLQDMGSLNGTYVNQKKLQGSRYLRIGDVISIGQHNLTVREEGYQPQGAEGTLLVRNQSGGEDSADKFGLTNREKDVLFHLLKGKTIPETAETLCVALGTVKNHVNHIYKKSGCHSRMELLQRFPDFV